MSLQIEPWVGVVSKIGLGCIAAIGAWKKWIERESEKNKLIITIVRRLNSHTRKFKRKDREVEHIKGNIRSLNSKVAGMDSVVRETSGDVKGMMNALNRMQGKDDARDQAAGR